MDLSKEWAQIARKLTWKHDSFFRDVIHKKYSESHRHYHNIRHVNSILRMLREYRGKNVNPALIVAAWFHDLCYDPRATDNELKSAEMCFDYLTSIGMHNDFICEVDDLIYSTVTHEARDGLTASVDDQKLFIDLDMAILGTRREKYDNYVDSILKENFVFFSMNEVRDGRANFLRKMLAREELYFTPEVKARYETRAFENMERELATY